jgi:hypothetical protein
VVLSPDETLALEVPVEREPGDRVGVLAGRKAAIGVIGSVSANLSSAQPSPSWNEADLGRARNVRSSADAAMSKISGHTLASPARPRRVRRGCLMPYSTFWNSTGLIFLEVVHRRHQRAGGSGPRYEVLAGEPTEAEK